MYYSWNWWWFVSWVIPMMFLVWVVFGWTGRRYRGYRTFYLADRDDDFVPDARFDRERRRADNRGRGPKRYRRSDERILEDICDRLTQDERVDATDVEVAVTNAHVKLTGYVSTRYERRVTESIVDVTPGVVDVDNELHVGAPESGEPQAPAQPSPPIAQSRA